MKGGFLRISNRFQKTKIETSHSTKFKASMDIVIAENVDWAEETLEVPMAAAPKRAARKRLLAIKDGSDASSAEEEMTESDNASEKGPDTDIASEKGEDSSDSSGSSASGGAHAKHGKRSKEHVILWGILSLTPKFRDKASTDSSSSLMKLLAQNCPSTCGNC